jgi:VanZ family protein
MLTRTTSRNKSALKVYLRFIPMVAIMGIIFFLSHQPGDLVQLPQVIGVDKLLHLIAYGVLAAAVLYGLHPHVHESRRTPAVLGVVLFCLLFGISDEFHQAFIPGRVVSAWDVAADSFGALLVVCLWYRQTGKSVTNCS